MISYLKKMLKAKETPVPPTEEVIKHSPVVCGSAFGVLDKNSSTWIFIEKHINERINFLRIKNDNPKLSEEKTHQLRGGIKELKKLLTIEEN